jgi:hypothetical protein
LYENIQKFEKHWQVFLKELFGCKDVGLVSPESCKPSEGKIDYAAWEKARKAAKDMFEYE